MFKKERGITLIELMVVVAIVGILAAIAYPGYQEQIRRARRADAQAALMGLANALERHFTANNTYCDAGGGGGANSCGGATNDTGSPSIYSTQSPLDGLPKYYNLTINPVTASSYTLNATPITGTAQAGDKCGTFTLTHTGVKGISGGSGGATADTCWK